MINYFKFFTVVLLVGAASVTFAQTSATTSSPYSKYGIGEYDESLLPQNRALGGIGTGVGKFSLFNDINVINPASYSFINLTTIDIGGFVGVNSLSKTGLQPQTSANFRLGHIAFAVPVSKHSALSFGIMPYSNLGYSYSTTNSIKINNGPIGPDTNSVVNNIYSGEGGLSKAYLGYGVAIGKHLSVGLNVAYIFGNEKQYRSTEFPQLATALSSRIENSFSTGGLNYDYGIQYVINVSDSRRLTLGYSGSAGSSLNETSSFFVSHYYLPSDGSAPAAIDTTTGTQTTGKLVLPTINRFGISYAVDNKFLFGADYKMGSWSDLSREGVNAGLTNSTSLALGAQITPNFNAISSYLAIIDYRLGFKYDKTYINVNGTDITQYGATFGLGMPIPNERRSTFYKINFSAEIGKRGTLDNNLVKETFFNFHLGFTINDKWFQKYKFD